MPKRTLRLLLIVACLLAVAALAEPVFSDSTRQVVSVWSELRIENAGAYSHLGAFGVRDCLRTYSIDCFSLQQNSWIIDSGGRLVLWARNMVYLASLNGAFHATYSFQVYSSNNRDQPLLCDPESNSSSTCRSPFYVDPSPFPQTFEFYMHISNGNTGSVLQMANNFGSAI